MRKKISLSGLRKKFWAIFSKYIRRRYADEFGMVKCFTCLNVHHWKELDAGHYVPASVSLALRYHESNVHPQCTSCNRYRHGNLTQYALALEKKYGPSILEELDSLRHTVSKYSRADYEEMISTYQKKLEEMGAE